MRIFPIPSLALLTLALCGPPVFAQASPQAPTYTLKARARVVLTDVVVQDRDGNPVTGLPASSFHITDDKKPQTLASFEEHRLSERKAVAQKPSARGVYSNAFAADPSNALDILVIDLTTLSFPDQAYLAGELNRFLDQLPVGQYVALYVKFGESTVPVLGFSTDRAQLKAALTSVFPRLRALGVENSVYAWANTLFQISSFVANVPGRKNVIWFTTSGTSFTDSDERAPVPLNLQPLYDELEANRIAIFPVDARGLTIARSDFVLHDTMSAIADATGGKAYYDGNGLGQFAVDVARNDANFYTLTYAPHDLRMDNRYHHVKVTVDAPEGQHFQLQYRRGYFDDGTSSGRNALDAAHKPDPNPNRLRLLPDGSAVQQSPNHQDPIVFTATVLPSDDPALDPKVPPYTSPIRGDARHGTRVSVQYEVSTSAITLLPSADPADPRDHFAFGAAAIAYNERGREINHAADKFSFSISPTWVLDHPGAPLKFQQILYLPKGQASLALALRDLSSSRTGTLQLSLKVPSNK
jgi:VWFA-related protein